ncbi:MAG: ketoacyl-ACP synthase III [Chloroflexaceae bacterium]|nr:ketoacyl-ACP synthase III [Chloroflexaceae bacterium]NJO04731.1 ketoacyl-ACP synthase III [Chloroflexaceae bacterium]
MRPSAAIIGWGMAVPQLVVTNDDLAQRMETSDIWIRSRTGIAERRIAEPHEYTSVLATRAAQQALERAAIDPQSIDLIMLATCTPDRLFPATACTIQANLGLTRAAAFDLAAACSGFLYGLSVAAGLIQGGAHRTILLVAADLFSHILNWNDRSTAVLFGDGAGAVVLQAHFGPLGVLSSVLGASGADEAIMMMEAGGTRLPLTPELLHDERRFFSMNGREVFRHAIREMGTSALEAVAAAGLTTAAIDLVVPHQANTRIIEALARRLNIPLERVFINIERYGNTSAASVPIALCEAADAGRLRHGDTVLLTAFGGGLTWASTVLRWGS